MFPSNPEWALSVPVQNRATHRLRAVGILRYELLKRPSTILSASIVSFILDWSI